MSEFANVMAEASGFCLDWLLTDEQRAAERQWETGTGNESEQLELDRGARIIQALADEVTRLRGEVRHG